MKHYRFSQMKANFSFEYRNLIINLNKKHILNAIIIFWKIDIVVSQYCGNALYRNLQFVWFAPIISNMKILPSSLPG